MCERAEIDDDTVRAFARDGSESAFSSLVERHSGWVYAAAFRQLRDAHLAEDATQTVFVLLCQRAKKMKPQQKLSGWLFLALGYTVRSILRSERRRRQYEELAALERPTSYMPPPLANDLDYAVSRLSESDRTAILLRFYQGLEFPAIGRSLGVSDEAAKKRVFRAIGRLRARLGDSVSVERLTAASAYGAPVALQALNAQVSSVALSAAGGGAVPAGVAPAMKGAVYLMAMAKAKNAAGLVIVILLMGTGVGIVGWQLFLAPAEPNVASVAQFPAPTVPIASTMPQTFEQVYGLRDNDVIRRVAPPFVAARMDFYRKGNASQARLIPSGPDGMLIFWRNGKPQLWGMTFARGEGFKIQDLMEYLLNVYPQNLAGDSALARTAIKGDFVIRGDANPEQLRAGLEAMIGNAIGRPVTLTFREVREPAMVFKGIWKAANHDSNNPFPTIEIYGLKLGDDGSGGGAGSVDELASWIGEWIKKPVIIEASGAPKMTNWHLNGGRNGSVEDGKRAHDPALVCKHMEEQTGLTWTKETRDVKKLFIEYVK
jgi:RNA polymerase sigma factor (sigma-70 family)